MVPNIIIQRKQFYLVLIICLLALKWPHVLLSNPISFICTQLNGSQYSNKSI